MPRSHFKRMLAHVHHHLRGQSSTLAVKRKWTTCCSSHSHRTVAASSIARTTTGLLRATTRFPNNTRCCSSNKQHVSEYLTASTCRSRRYLSTSSQPQPPFKVAIVGSGPSGLYTAKYLQAAWKKLSHGGTIDVLERLPLPYGLVRFGVAPDHPEVKNVQHDFDALFADSSSFESKSQSDIRYWGNVRVGQDVSLDELRHCYDAVVLATGCESDRRLDLPIAVGGQLQEEQQQQSAPPIETGILSAREFVAWYNGHPDYCHIGEHVQRALGGGDSVDSTTSNTTPLEKNSSLMSQVRMGVSVVVVGHGNVALDCARILSKGGTGLFDTDLASHALPILAGGVEQVSIVGRRGHVQGAFTIKEVRELVNLQKEGHDAAFYVRPDELDLGGTTESSMEELNGKGGRPKQRIDKLLREAAASEPDQTASKRIHLRFLLNPVSWESNPEDPTKLQALICERTRLEGEPGKQRAIGTGEMERIPAQLALLSIGYKGIPLPGLKPEQFDEDRGVVRHVEGRMEAPGDGMGGLYSSGWIKRGPSGIIGTNIPDARETVSSILHDLGTLDPNNRKSDGMDLKTLCQQRNVKVIDWEAYQRIVQREESSKRSESQPREKITDLQELIQTALLQ